MNFAELYTAMEQGTVDGQENPSLLVLGSKLYEVQKYLALTNHSITTQPLVISEKFWKGLTPAIQKAIQEAATESQAFNYKVVDQQNKTAVADLKAKGMQVTAPYSTKFRELIQHEVWPKFEDTFGASLMKRIQDVKCTRAKGKITCHA
jgi:TRAP-type C4-dicarboxylate transport system substrate-binding protein